MQIVWFLNENITLLYMLILIILVKNHEHAHYFECWWLALPNLKLSKNIKL